MIVLLIALTMVLACAMGVHELMQHKKDRSYGSAGGRSPFRRGPVRSAKVD